MEQQSQPQQENITDRSTAKGNDEKPSSTSLRSKTLKCLRAEPPKPINTSFGNMEGDNMINRWAMNKVLLKLCAEAEPPIQLGEDSLPIRTGTNEGLDLFTEAQRIIDGNPSLAVDKNATLSRQRMILLANALGVSMTDEELDSIPQPLRSDHGLFKKFDREFVLHRAMELEEQQNGSFTVTIVQGGSSPWKRFSNEQIRELIETVKQTFEAPVITILTDFGAPNPRYSDVAGERVEGYFGSDVKVIKTTNINEISAQLAKCTDVVISTDTLFAHLAAGCQEMARHRRNDFSPAQILVLYTLANPKIWGSKGIIPVISKFLKQILAKGEQAIYPGTIGVIAPHAYIELASEAQIEGIEGDSDDNRYDPEAISPFDIDLLKMAISHVR